MVSLRHWTLAKRVLWMFLGVNSLLILMSSRQDRGSYTNAYVTVTVKYPDDIQAQNEIHIPPTSRENITTTTIATEAKTKTKISPVETVKFFVGQRLHERADFTREQCSLKWSEKLGPFLKSYVFFDDRAKLAQCSVVKAGSTYWGRIFSFLTRPEMMKSLNIRAPAQIDRIWLHHRRGVRGKLIRGNDTDDIFKRAQPLRFFFSRDPFKRLWSTYLDKYFLPGFWLHDPIGNRTDMCEKNVSFEAFLEHAVKSDDPHVLPVSLACNPCAFKPDVIGEMETFTSDTEHILRHANYSHFLADYDEGSYIEREIMSLSAYNFMVRESVKKCLKLKDLSRKLWRVFQYNGHIRESFQFPEERPDYSPLSSAQMFLDAVKTRPLISRDESKRQKHTFLSEAYRDIPDTLVQLIRMRYEADFALFRYGIDPPA